MPSKYSIILIAVLLLSVWLITTGFTDLDWQLVSYRYSEWHRTVETWEYCPFLVVNWWLAYMINVVRIMVGCFMLGIVTFKVYLYEKGESNK